MEARRRKQRQGEGGLLSPTVDIGNRTERLNITSQIGSSIKKRAQGH